MSEVQQSPGGAGSRKDPKDPKIIKRYTNRKLYDTVESRYVTLEEIAEMIKAGAEVKIVDNRSKDDLTSVTLAQIIFEEEKKTSRMPLAVLRDIIRNGGETLSDFLHQQVGQMGQKVASIKGEAETLRDRILRRDAEERERHEAGRTGPVDHAKEMVTQSQRALEDWQKRLDDRVRHTVENITSLPVLARDVASLEKKIEELERKLAEYEKRG